MPPRNQWRRAELAQTARETITALPRILNQLPQLDATASTLYSPETLPPLPPAKGDVVSPPSNASATSPPPDQQRPTAATVHVLNEDSFDAAISLISPTDTSPVAVLNLASDVTPGGGWRSGALAQEECLCYRSSLALSLHKRYYPLPPASVVYSPTVVVIRDAWARGHGLLVSVSENPKIMEEEGGPDSKAGTKGEETENRTRPEDLPILSVLTVAAIRRPGLRTERLQEAPYTAIRTTWANPADRESMRLKMRIALRTAALHGHRKLVLGALGCGAFRNPHEEVARLWKDVLSEDEFMGRGLWDEIVFAVLDKGSDGGNGSGLNQDEGNFGIFHQVLDGVVV
jgi:hypothetical protein